METLSVGDLAFELRRSPRRKTLQVTIDRDGELVISAPNGCSVDAMAAFVNDKRFWIYTKLAEKEALRSPPSPKAYVTGEGFPYLGRNYRLLLVTDQPQPVVLSQGRFKMRRRDADDGRAHMVRWYTAHANRWLSERVDRFKGRVAVAPTGVAVQYLGYRWGSCSKGGRLNFHWRAILLPPRIVDYIVVHELAHLHEPHHTPAFWRRVERAMPDFAARKQWLAEHASSLVAV